MAIKLKPLSEQVIVITGASSGIGLATAKAAAKKGAKLVLASRNEEGLREAEQEVKTAGGQAVYVVADVGRMEDVKSIAEKANESYGGFDSWVNNAGVSIYGSLMEISEEDHRKLFETNFWGVVYGSQVAALHLKNKGGAIINVGSVLSDYALPMQGMYSASKHAVKGFTDAFRQELENEKAPISITLIKPASINTPYTEHARNYTSRENTVPPPVYAPEEVANAILYAATHQKRDIFVGGAGKFMSTTNRYAPSLMDWMGKNMFIKQQFREDSAKNRDGALHEHQQDGNVHGNYKGYMRKKSFFTRASMYPVIAGSVLAVGAAAITILSRRN
ncbi:MAG: SDR family oxidoreductase [Cyclobacteriaceae bacterium]